MEFKGTKGKWSVGIVPEYNNILKSAMIEIHTNNIWVCKVQNNGIIQSGEGNHNALLISKAPEMLEMLINLTNKLKCTTEYEAGVESFIGIIKESEQLIKQATEL